METCSEQNLDLTTETQQIYQPEQVVADIDQQRAQELGRVLSESQYRMIGAGVINAGSRDTVANLLWQIDRSNRYRQAMAKNPKMLIGPYFMRIAGDDFCPPGIGVWVPEQIDE